MKMRPKYIASLCSLYVMLLPPKNSVEASGKVDTPNPSYTIRTSCHVCSFGRFRCLTPGGAKLQFLFLSEISHFKGIVHPKI